MARDEFLISRFEMVALLEDVPGKDLWRGQVGKVIEKLADDFYEVEFGDERGQVYAMAPFHSNQLLPLHFCKLNRSREQD